MDRIKLLQFINHSGLKHKYIAKQLSISYQGLWKKLNNITEFKVSEVKSLCDLLKISNEQKEEIFFKK